MNPVNSMSEFAIIQKTNILSQKFTFFCWYVEVDRATFLVKGKAFYGAHMGFYVIEIP